jgi:NADH-quinone oxidoreductase subunit M
MKQNLVIRKKSFIASGEPCALARRPYGSDPGVQLYGYIYASFTAIRQTDFKRIIAYTSIAHMNLVILGIFSFNVIGLEGAILQSLSHGFIASGLFLVIGVVYDRYRTRIVQYYGGLAIVMPVGVKKMW